MKTVTDRSKSGKKHNTNFTLKNRLISLYFDMKRICTRVKMSIYSLWIYTGSVLQCSGWSVSPGVNIINKVSREWRPEERRLRHLTLLVSFF